VARAPQFVDHQLIVDLDVKPVFRKRLLDPRGRASARPLPEILISSDTRAPAPHVNAEVAEPLARVAEVYEALVVGTRDYVRKNGFTEVVIGMSGGIDSSLVAVIAADALGSEHVHGVSMPSRYSSKGSKDDARELAEALGIDFRTIPIEPAHSAFLEMLRPSFEGRPEDLTEENLQSRVRGVTLMALSNKFGWLVLATGNKSEMATGFATIYGDMVGGYAVIKDVPKTLVYELCRERNRRGAVIPESVLTKPPSAELRPGQRDDQSLPPYELLDPILEAYVEDDLTASELVQAGSDPELVRRVVQLVEPGRVQAPPGPARRACHGQGLRQGPPPPDHQPLLGLMERPSKGALAHLALVGAAFFFGTTFVVVNDAVARADPVPFLAVRFLIGAAVVWPLAARRPSTPGVARAGVLCGLALLVGYVFQTVGLQYLSSSVSAFITYLLVLMVPVLSAAVLRRAPSPSTVLGIVLAAVGLFLLNGAATSFGKGELLTLGCALFFAVHIVLLAEFAPRYDAIRLNAVQLTVVRCRLSPSRAFHRRVRLPAVRMAGCPLHGRGGLGRRVRAHGVGPATGQPVRTALLLMLEPVFAAVVGAIAGDHLGLLGATGAALILGGVLVAELRGQVTIPSHG